MTGKKAKEYIKAINFLQNHPGLSEFIYYNVEFYPYMICKNKVNDEFANGNPNIIIDSKDKKYSKLVKKFPPDEPNDFIIVPYKDYYGYSWKFHKMEYFFGISFQIFNQTAFEKNKRHEYDYENYFQKYYGTSFNTDTIEDGYIKIAKWVKENLGDWSRYDFYTPEEIKNHTNNTPFFSIPYNKKTNGKLYYKMESNSKWITVYDWQLNLRWAKWLKTTEYWRKTWEKPKKSKE